MWRVRQFLILLLGMLLASAGQAEQKLLSYTTYGTLGLIDMPTAQSTPDAELAGSVLCLAGSTRTTLPFQIAPRLSGSIRYTGVKNWDISTRSGAFDLRYRVFCSGFAVRPGRFTGLGGRVESAKWFRSDTAFFGGVAWQATDLLVLKTEYSTDAYTFETGRGHITRKSPFNFGLATILVKARAPNSVTDLGWATQPAGQKILCDNLQAFLGINGMMLETLKVTGYSAVMLVCNNKYIASAKAIGRLARTLTHVMPELAETFTIVPVINGNTTSAVTLQRTYMEELEPCCVTDRANVDCRRGLRGA